jgi:ferredoxin
MTMKLVVDWPLCDGNGVCTIEVPELLTLNDDGDLVVIAETFGPELKAKVDAAVRVCPKHALRIDQSK